VGREEGTGCLEIEGLVLVQSGETSGKWNEWPWVLHHNNSCDPDLINVPEGLGHLLVLGDSSTLVFNVLNLVGHSG
jgi:hypothetical protein